VRNRKEALQEELAALEERRGALEEELAQGGGRGGDGGGRAQGEQREALEQQIGENPAGEGPPFKVAAEATVQERAVLQG